jgi:hypothetical protein
VPAVDGLAHALRELRHRFDLGRDRLRLAQLHEAVKACVVRQEGDLLVARLRRDLEHLPCIGQPLLHHVRGSERPVAAVQRRDERFGIAQAPRHVDRAARRKPLSATT